MNVNCFIGLPYREGARGPDAFDCYGLIIEVFRQLRGINLPDFYQDGPGVQQASRAIAAAVRGEAAGGRCEKVEEPQNFDFAIAGSATRPHHVGLVANGGVLHASKAFGSAWHPVYRFKMLYPETGFYRWHL